MVIDKKLRRLRKSDVVIVLYFLGHPEAYITDFSRIGDFDLTNRKLRELSRLFGFKVKSLDFVVDVIRRLGKPDTFTGGVLCAISKFTE